jgi:hypothetical protein
MTINSLAQKDVVIFDADTIADMPYDETITSFVAAEAGVGIWDEKARIACHIAEALHRCAEKPVHETISLPPKLFGQILELAS